jgi:Mg-chelatase subunit ChlD
VLVLDGSGSVGTSGWDLLKTWAERLADGYNLSPSGVNLGIVQFSETVQTETANMLTSASQVSAAFSGINYIKGDYTNIELGLDAALTLLQTKGRSGVERQVVLLTDGRANRCPSCPTTGTPYDEAAAALVSFAANMKTTERVELFTVAVRPDEVDRFGEPDYETLRAASSVPRDAHSLVARSFGDLDDSLIETLVTRPCPPSRPSMCFEPVDYVFVLDKSGSIEARSSVGIKEQEQIRTFVNGVLESLPILADGSKARVAIVGFSWIAWVETQDSRVSDSFFWSDRAALEGRVNSFFTGGPQFLTSTAWGLKRAREVLESDFRRDGVKAITFVVTDGLPTVVSRDGESSADDRIWGKTWSDVSQVEPATHTVCSDAVCERWTHSCEAPFDSCKEERSARRCEASLAGFDTDCTCPALVFETKTVTYKRGGRKYRRNVRDALFNVEFDFCSVADEAAALQAVPNNKVVSVGVDLDRGRHAAAGRSLLEQIASDGANGLFEVSWTQLGDKIGELAQYDCTPVCDASLEVWVDPATGSDSNSGAESAPVKTIARALAVSASKAGVQKAVSGCAIHLVASAPFSSPLVLSGGENVFFRCESDKDTLCEFPGTGNVVEGKSTTVYAEGLRFGGTAAGNAVTVRDGGSFFLSRTEFTSDAGAFDGFVKVDGGSFQCVQCGFADASSDADSASRYGVLASFASPDTSVRLYGVTFRNLAVGVLGSATGSLSTGLSSPGTTPSTSAKESSLIAHDVAFHGCLRGVAWLSAAGSVSLRSLTYDAVTLGSVAGSASGQPAQGVVVTAGSPIIVTGSRLHLLLPTATPASLSLSSGGALLDSQPVGVALYSVATPDEPAHADLLRGSLDRLTVDCGGAGVGVATGALGDFQLAEATVDHCSVAAAAFVPAKDGRHVSVFRGFTFGAGNDEALAVSAEFGGASGRGTVEVRRSFFDASLSTVISTCAVSAGVDPATEAQLPAGATYGSCFTSVASDGLRGGLGDEEGDQVLGLDLPVFIGIVAGAACCCCLVLGAFCMLGVGLKGRKRRGRAGSGAMAQFDTKASTGYPNQQKPAGFGGGPAY